MYKIILALFTLSLLSTNSLASDIIWSIDHENHAYINSQDHASMAVYLQDIESVAFLGQREFCNPRLDKKRKAIILVNNQAAEMFVACGETTQKLMYVAVSEAGREFVKNEFKMKNVVVIGDFKFSAKGFNRTIRQVTENNSNAL